MKTKITLLASVVLLVANIALPTFSIAQVTQEWASRYNGPGSGADYARSLAVDGSGNMYVTGVSTEYGTNSDYLTIKYNSTGDTLWIARYNGPGNGSDQAYALALDGSGNVFVTGKSVGIGIYSDYATIKYDSTGVEQWVARYNGPANNSDEAKSLAVDASGNVYVTGRSPGSGISGDYATIKYSQQTVGIETIPAKSSLMHLFPNPTTISVTIKFLSDEAGEIQVVNLFGQIVYSEKVNAEQTQIDVSRFAAGMYVI